MLYVFLAIQVRVIAPMSDAITHAMLWTSALGSGVIGGVFFAFSASIMQALARLGPQDGVAAMNAINTVIVRSLFLPVFFGTALSGILAGAGAITHWDEPGSGLIVVGALAYLVGVICTTMVVNVPLNRELAVVASPADTASTWARYLLTWVRWNHLRTVASLLSSAFFVVALRLC